MQLSIKELGISKELNELKNLLKNHTTRAYFVGGFVRDCFLNIKTKDIDIEVFDITPLKFDALMREIKADGVGKNYFVYKWQNFDISLPRTESKTGFGHKAFEVKLTNSLKLAAKRRDFTINSIMIDIFSDEVVDNYGGISDIKNKILRVVDEKTFVEDSLRVLRGVQFVARFGLEVEPNTLNLMKSISLNDLSKDRISAELLKLFNAKFKHLGLKLIYELGLDEFLFGAKFKHFNELYELIKNGQNFVKNEMFFLYTLSNFLNLDKAKLLKRLNLSTKFKRILTEPYFKNPTDEDLLSVWAIMPLKEWLGLNSQSLVNRAKKLNIYDRKFFSKITAKSVIDDGFSGKDIGLEIKRRQNLELKEYLKSIK
ncbi:CCA tRNA nucleotidyltransferase [Campylobacter corcagiensis]|uniref:CCA tRNA nucleotidyltransferase n=1 Tax=Campylobacter corcagiensis TaxID=1448857 RepID=A0A7M1LEK2_9BACT|nr:CCA tRNA nucleotidyltransferase [Campylobacter corcagiensis]QOQ86999.1 CCA tRNA nucleotidyltransferase [Campylobacter corcagiensis]